MKWNEQRGKDDATKGDMVDIDLLHEQLIVLESISRKINKKGHGKMSLIISGFHTHKRKPAFAAALVLKLLFSKEEEVVLDKEQKLMNSFNSSVTPLQHVPQQHMSFPLLFPLGFMGNQPYFPSSQVHFCHIIMVVCSHHVDQDLGQTIRTHLYASGVRQPAI